MIKILFVCHGNICRSTMAEFVFKHLIQNQTHPTPKIPPHQFLIASAATSREEIGNPVHRGTAKILDTLGIDYSAKRATRMTGTDYRSYDYLIGMDSANIRNMIQISGGDPEGKICRLMDFTGEPKDVADPWYTGDFDTTYQDVSRGCEALLAYIEEKERQSHDNP